jgi:hypothetical protein
MIIYNFYIHRPLLNRVELNIQVFYLAYMYIHKIESWKRSWQNGKWHDSKRRMDKILCIIYTSQQIWKWRETSRSWICKWSYPEEAEKQEQESEFIPAGATTTTTTEAEEIAKTTTNEPAVTATTTPSMKPSPTQQQKGGQETISSIKSLSKQLDKQTIQINKKITQILQPLQKQSQSIKQLQSQMKQLQKQVSQIQRVVSIKKKKK